MIITWTDEILQFVSFTVVETVVNAEIGVKIFVIGEYTNLIITKS